MVVTVAAVGLFEVAAGIVCHRSARAPRILRGRRIATLILGTWLVVSGLLVMLGQLIDGSFDLFMRINAFSAIGAIPAIFWAQHLDQDATKKIVLIREIAGLLEWRASELSNVPAAPEALPSIPAIGWVYDEDAYADVEATREDEDSDNPDPDPAEG